MSYTLLSETKPKARKDHRCIWCGQKIPKGEQYLREKSVFDGEMQNAPWHLECWTASREEIDGFDWEFFPYENERPGVLA